MSAPMRGDVIKIHPSDTVIVALRALKKGERVVVDDAEIEACCAVNFGHKVALRAIKTGEVVIKYGYPIGTATADIPAGAHVHTHNVRTSLTDHVVYSYAPVAPALTHRAPRTFMGYRRKNGKAGIRNEVWIIPTVGCVNPTGDAIARQFDGVYSFPHPFGCSQLGDDHENTKKILCGLAHHPNAGGVLILGLGCENNSIAEMREMLGEVDETRVKFLNCQDVDDEVTAAVDLVKEILAEMQHDKREEIPTSELIIGLKCGGSDGLSGLTANPLVGAFSDMLISEGGSTILTEVPEMFGAEEILMNRCKDEATFEKTVRLINDFKQYFTDNKQPIYENPSPGNKAGGISTLEDKALGCTQKAGMATVIDVLAYGEILREKGLNLLNSPGNDLVASTALAASGAHIVLFTTGRGTPFGAPVPTVKISSNTALYEKKRHWIDFNAEPLLGETTQEALAEDFYAYILRLASGTKRTKTEQHGIRDLAIFKTGVTL
ncbi:MAG: altronate dehydratase family protein [Defluviitaleaceae bacterium]|nr:altronate dehydratase family protein [Defluviitaleaceae bacterium]MCL2275222.1 altronate dehydratase family protein [Defluviitaleaceae bacterium]